MFLFDHERSKTMATYKTIYVNEQEREILLKLVNWANRQLNPLDKAGAEEKKSLNNLKEMLES